VGMGVAANRLRDILDILIERRMLSEKAFLNRYLVDFFPKTTLGDC